MTKNTNETVRHIIEVSLKKAAQGQGQEPLEKGQLVAARTLVHVIKSLPEDTTTAEASAAFFSISVLFGDCACAVLGGKGKMIDGSDGCAGMRAIIKSHFDAELRDEVKDKLIIGMAMASL